MKKEGGKEGERGAPWRRVILFVKILRQWRGKGRREEKENRSNTVVPLSRARSVPSLSCSLSSFSCRRAQGSRGRRSRNGSSRV
jgi:hypothetical protein